MPVQYTNANANANTNTSTNQPQHANATATATATAYTQVSRNKEYSRMLLDRLGKYEQLNLGLKKELDKERKSHQVSHAFSRWFGGDEVRTGEIVPTQSFTPQPPTTYQPHNNPPSPDPTIKHHHPPPPTTTDHPPSPTTHHHRPPTITHRCRGRAKSLVRRQRRYRRNKSSSSRPMWYWHKTTPSRSSQAT